MTDSIGSRERAAPEATVSTEVALVEAPSISDSTERDSRPGARPLRALLNLLPTRVDALNLREPHGWSSYLQCELGYFLIHFQWVVS